MTPRFAIPPDDTDLPSELLAVESALDAIETPTVRPEFRASLRARFLAGDFTSEAEHVLAPLQAPPPARETFRAELRERFLAGAAMPDADSSASRPSVVASSRVRSRGTQSRRTQSRGGQPKRAQSTFRRAGWVLAAAALLLMIPLLPLGRAESGGWRVVSSPEVTSVRLDGESIESGDAQRLDAHLSGPECQLESGARVVRFARDQNLLLQVDPESRVRLSPFFALEGDGLLVDLERGAVAVSLAAGFSERIVVQTPYGRVAVEGRAIGVELVGGGLCICCLEGEARFLGEGGEEEDVTSGTTLFRSAEGQFMRLTDRVAHPDALIAALAVAGEHLSD